MKLRELSVKNIRLQNNLFIAPMAGYTDYGFRHLQIEQGVGLTFTELVSAKGIVYGGSNNKSLLYAGNDYDRTAVQIFGADPYYMRKACEDEQLVNFKIVDINMGCPVPKVYKNGEGSALLNDLKKAQAVIKECVKSGKIITVKIRTGLKNGDDIATEFSKGLEDAGASLISIHGRVRENYYSGEPDYNAIYKAKKAVSVPIIANGGIFSVEDADKMLDKTGADGVMLGRGIVDNPFLSCEILGSTPKMTLKEYVLSHIDLMLLYYPDRKATVEFRKFVSRYFREIKNIKDVKQKLLTCDNTEQIKQIISQNF